MVVIQTLSRKTLRRLFMSQQAIQIRHDPLGGLAVPQGRAAAVLALAGQHLGGFFEDARRIGAHQHVAAFVDGHRALGVFAQGEAGDAQGGGFFLQAAAVGHDQRGVLPQVEEFHVRLGLGEHHVGAQIQPELLEVAAGTRVHREDQRQVGGDLLERAGNAAQVGFVVHVGRTVAASPRRTWGIGP